MVEQLYKKCATCDQFYPGVLGDIHDRCPKHVKHFDRTVYHVKKTRSISPEVYDVYWKDEAGYHRACRGCGKPLLRKNGKPCSLAYSWRWCSIACAQKLPSPNWGQTSQAFLRSHETRGKYPHLEIQCQRCGEWFRFAKAEVHHVKPVATLAEDEIKLIWDYSNLMVLCHGCHDGTMHEAVYQQRAAERKGVVVQQEVKQGFNMRLF